MYEEAFALPQECDRGFDHAPPLAAVYGAPEPSASASSGLVSGAEGYGECPLCKMYEGREYNAEMLEAFEEAERMIADPSLGKTYATVKEMMDELLADVHA
jgi:hypothetical protein